MVVVLSPVLRIVRWTESVFHRAMVRMKPLALAMALGLCLTVSACSGGGLLSGNYVEDTAMVSQTLMTTLALPPDAPDSAEAVGRARALINDYMARYRPRRAVNGLPSFTTMQTALNSLASHYATYANNRPLPDPQRSRVQKELEQAAAAASKGA